MSYAAVSADGEIVGEIGRGLAILVGVTHNDSEFEAEWLARKIAGIRLFEDEDGKMNLSLADVGGSVLVVSQFTLYGDARKGRRPSFVEAAAPEQAEMLVEHFTGQLRQSGLKVETGVFGARMKVEIHNDGPVTLMLEK